MYIDFPACRSYRDTIRNTSSTSRQNEKPFLGKSTLIATSIQDCHQPCIFVSLKFFPVEIAEIVLTSHLRASDFNLYSGAENKGSSMLNAISILIKSELLFTTVGVLTM